MPRLIAKYFIAFRWQENSGDHWKVRRKAIWPILFPTRQAAQTHLDSVQPFQNMLHRRKLSCCVERTRCVFPAAEGLA